MLIARNAGLLKDRAELTIAFPGHFFFFEAMNRKIALKALSSFPRLLIVGHHVHFRLPFAFSFVKSIDGLDLFKA